MTPLLKLIAENQNLSYACLMTSPSLSQAEIVGCQSHRSGRAGTRAREISLSEDPSQPLIRLDSDERIQGNPSFSNPQNLGFSQRNGDVPRKPKPGRRTASRPPPRRSQTDSIQMHSGLTLDTAKLRHPPQPSWAV